LSAADRGGPPVLLGLVGDVGGTHARFALATRHEGRVYAEQALVFLARDYPTGEDAIRAYLQKVNAGRLPAAVVAAAGPVMDGAVTFTNNPAWRFSEPSLKSAGGFEEARLINDFTAQALAIDHLQPDDCRLIGPRGRHSAGGNAVILGPGTGFGVAARVDDGRGRAILTGEGGHMSFPPDDPEEIEILSRLARRFGHVSIERVLSGPGLLNLYQTLAEIRGEPATASQPDEVTRGALAGEPLRRLALERFCAILGSVAGDFALAYGALDGVYISGGIAPAIIEVLKASDFRRRFEAKGRFVDYLRPIPTRVVMEPRAALIGAAGLLATLGSSPL
jgi:glucokinase